MLVIPPHDTLIAVPVNHIYEPRLICGIFPVVVRYCLLYFAKRVQFSRSLFATVDNTPDINSCLPRFHPLLCAQPIPHPRPSLQLRWSGKTGIPHPVVAGHDRPIASQVVCHGTHHAPSACACTRSILHSVNRLSKRFSPYVGKWPQII